VTALSETGAVPATRKEFSLETENSPLSFLEAYTMLARDTVMAIEEDPEDDIVKFREALAFLSSARDPGDGGALLAWVDDEMERARQYTETGKEPPKRFEMDTPLALPDAAAQLDTVWHLFRTMAQRGCTEKDWEAMQYVAWPFTERGDLDYLIEGPHVPPGGFVTKNLLHVNLDQARAAYPDSQPGSAAVEVEGTLRRWEDREPLTLLDACTLMARETVSMLMKRRDALDFTIRFRDTLAFLNSKLDLGDGGALLAWVDNEMERTRQFNKTGKLPPGPVSLEAPLALPDPVMQIDAVWRILRASTETGYMKQQQWEDIVSAVNSFTRMEAMHDLLLNAYTPPDGFLTVEILRSGLAQAQTAFQGQRPEPAESGPSLSI